MNSQELMEQFQSKLRDEGRRLGREEGREEGLEGLRRGLAAAYTARFGAAPNILVEALQAIHDSGRLIGLAALFATGTPEQIAGVLGVKLH